MSILRSLQEVRRITDSYVQRTCPHCRKEYELGVNGVEDGCDSCEGIVRLPNGMIDYEAMNSEEFIKRLEQL